MDIISKLTNHIFADCTEAELSYLIKFAHIKTFNKDDVIIKEGDIGTDIYVILAGSVDVIKNTSPDMPAMKLANLGPESVLGEISIITNNPRSATVIATMETTVLIVNIALIKQDTAAKSLYEKLIHNLTIELSKKLIYAGNNLIKCDTKDQYAAELIEDNAAIAAPNSIAVLFGWKWLDIMYEVPFLAEHGYDAIKIYPPQEFVLRTGNPWWEVYQPVSYELSSFYGTKEDFIKMVDFCHSYNIKVYADLILNHMAEFAGIESKHIGTNGHEFNKYNYNNLNSNQDKYEYDDFYHFEPESNKQISGEDYGKLESIWNLEHYDLVSLPKLNLDSKHVKSVLRKYVQYLLSMGIDGFRIDAAKHLKIRAVEQILFGLRTHDDFKPFIYQEYFADVPMGIDAYSFMKKYFQIGYVTAFKYGEILSSVIKNKTDNNLQKLVEYSFGGAWINYPDNRAVVVIDNHDTERMMPNILNYKDLDNNAYVLAYIFMLAWPFGIPKIMSGFRFNTHNDAIPKTRVWQDGRNTCFDKDSPWVAQHRWNAIANMVLFRSKTKEATGISHVFACGNQVAFARTYQKAGEYVTSYGFVVINNTASTLSRRFETGLPSGNYYDFIASGIAGGKMQGLVIKVEDYGFANITVKPFDAVVIALGFLQN